MTDQTGVKKLSPFWRLGVLLAFVLAILLIGFKFEAIFGISLQEIYHRTPEAIRDMGAWGRIIIIGLMIVHSFIPFPAEFLALIAGSTYGVWEGTILIWVGGMAGASISFALTRIFGQPFIEWVLSANQKRSLDQWVIDQGAMTMLISRFIPLIAFNLINYAAGLTTMRWWTFLWTTGVGILPLTAFMVFMGASMQQISWQLLAVICLVSIAFMFALSRILKSTRKNTSV